MRDDDFQFSKIPKLLDCLHTYCQVSATRPRNLSLDAGSFFSPSSNEAFGLVLCYAVVYTGRN